MERNRIIYIAGKRIHGQEASAGLVHVTGAHVIELNVRIEFFAAKQEIVSGGSGRFDLCLLIQPAGGDMTERIFDLNEPSISVIGRFGCLSKRIGLSNDLSRGIVGV